MSNEKKFVKGDELCMTIYGWAGYDECLIISSSDIEETVMSEDMSIEDYIPGLCWEPGIEAGEDEQEFSLSFDEEGQEYTVDGHWFITKAKKRFVIYPVDSGKIDNIEDEFCYSASPFIDRSRVEFIPAEVKSENNAIKLAGEYAKKSWEAGSTDHYVFHVAALDDDGDVMLSEPVFGFNYRAED